MNHSDKRIPIVQGFQCRTFKYGSIPNNQILTEFFSQGTLGTQTSSDSQILLKEHSNRLVNNPIDHTFLKPTCETLGVEFDELFYHLMLTDYIDYFFLPMPNLNTAGAEGKMLKIAAGIVHKNSKSSLEEFKTNIPADTDRYDSVVKNLKKRFPDYQLADDFISAFYIKLVNDLKCCLEFVERYRSEMEELKQGRLSNYRLPSSSEYSLKAA
jgi:hypothetical protein